MNGERQEHKRSVIEGKTYLGIEFGSTRIKATLIDNSFKAIAQGGYGWENSLADGIWTYSMREIWDGMRACYRNMAEDVREKYGIKLETVGAIGISGMMSGYMPFDNAGNILATFRTWRNNMTERESAELSELFGMNIPQRYSIAHLYDVIRDGQEHLNRLSFMTTLSGYIHWKLTGERVIGIGEASGMFPVDTTNKCFDKACIEKFEKHIAHKNYPWKLSQILPRTLLAGENAGYLTEEGAKLLDPDGSLKSGIPFCPPEGDAGTGMVATNCVRPNTCNVSAGTSVFSMTVMENGIKGVYPEVDPVTTPSGECVALVHSNNCTSDINAWAKLFGEFLEAYGAAVDQTRLYQTVYGAALRGDADCGRMLAYNYISGEHITGFEEGRPLFVRRPDSKMSFANFMRMHLYTALGSLRTGMQILNENENVHVVKTVGHGGFFKTEEAGQKILAAALNTPVTVMETAGEGGSWGMAILAAYMCTKGEDELLADYLENRVFGGNVGNTVQPDAVEAAGYDVFMRDYAAGLEIERTAVRILR